MTVERLLSLASVLRIGVDELLHDCWPESPAQVRNWTNREATLSSVRGAINGGLTPHA